MTLDQMNRREMLKSLLGMTAAMMAPEVLMGQSPPATQRARDRLGQLLPLRKLGKTGKWVTMLGLGGSHVGRPSEAEAQKMVETALEGGVRFFDTAAVYQNGDSESRLGKFLTPKYRDVAFIMTKSRTQESAQTRKDLDDSLRRLNTDYIDLWQMHENTSVDDVNVRLDNGVLEVLLDAKARGKVRHIGFTGHTTPDAHLRMLERMKEKGDPLETCQMPINVADPNYGSFIMNVLPVLMERGYGVLAMKTLAGGGFSGARGGPAVVPARVSASDALHFVWSWPISVLISGPDSAEQYQQTISIAKSFSGMSEEKRKDLIAKLADIAGPAARQQQSEQQRVEYYKA